MTDHDLKLLKLAARAAGIDFNTVRLTRKMRTSAYIPPLEDDREFWNPLTNDGDALRLAVKLRMSIYVNDDSSEVRIELHDGLHWVEICDKDSCATVRRAIVQVAAVIGKRMS